MELMDVMPQGEWEELVDGFAREVGMTACLADREGNPMFCRADRFPLCAAVRVHEQAKRSICSQTNAAMLAVVKQTLLPEVDLCEAGMLRAVVPVVRDSAPIGHVMTCGLACEDEELSELLLTRELGISKEQVRALAQETPVGSEDELGERAAALYGRLNSTAP